MPSYWRLPFLPHEKLADRMLTSPPLELNFLITHAKGTPLCMVVQTEQARCATTTLEEQILKDSETVEVPQSVNCLLLAQHQTDETPLAWVNRKLCVFLWTFSGATFLDQGWKVWCRGIRGVWKSMLMFLQQRCWSHLWGSKDMAGHNNFNSPSLWSRDCKLITLWGHEMGALAHALIFGVTFILNTDAVRTGIPHARDPYQSYPVEWVEKSCSKS